MRTDAAVVNTYFRGNRMTEQKSPRWSDDPWSALTMDEAAAWRAGYAAARAQAEMLARRGTLWVTAAGYLSSAAVADAIAAMEPPGSPKGGG
jgi:hypothetical protein